MNYQLFRIDDRLIHGQVVIGWAGALHSREILLCDNEVNENDWEKELYLSCVPENLTAAILDERHTAEALLDNSRDFSKSIFLVKGPEIVEHLLDQGVRLDKVNVGGIHFKEGRRNYLPYLYLSAAEIESFRHCMERGVVFECQDVPTGMRHDLKLLLEL
ncbi:MAG: PTS mannose/fructose/sorbose transporter subunit IIB [Calditrichaeota bacterium]|nr:MAG: PTS mannose/fructose/sorbose transporter subunit IIB [Calditrichota bacterium]